MKNIKYILLAVVAVLFGSSVSAQSIKIVKTDGTSIVVPYSELDCIIAVDEQQSNHEFVDLGLSVKWATCNVGAQSVEDYGDYFAWGETAVKDSYDSNNSITNGVPMEDFAGNAEYDAAAAVWGGGARMPTKAELEELVSDCVWQISSENGITGMLITGPNNNSIFMPLAGNYDGTTLSLDGIMAQYLSSTPYESDDRAYVLQLYSFGDKSVYWGYRKNGYTVRAVCE